MIILQLCHTAVFLTIITVIAFWQVVLPPNAGLVLAPGGRPEVVDLIFNGTPMREKKTKLFNGLTPGFKLKSNGPYALGRGWPEDGYTKEMFSANIDHLISSFPDYTINSAIVKATPELLEIFDDTGTVRGLPGMLFIYFDSKMTPNLLNRQNCGNE